MCFLDARRGDNKQRDFVHLWAPGYLGAPNSEVDFHTGEKVTAFVDGAVSEMFEPENERSEDQQVFNDYLKRRPITDAGPQPESSRFRIRVLDPPKYPIGRADEAFLKLHESVLIHANWPVPQRLGEVSSVHSYTAGWRGRKTSTRSSRSWGCGSRITARAGRFPTRGTR